MTKKEREEQIEKGLYIFENPAEYALEERIAALEQTLLDCREYIDDYKTPAKHIFMGSTIKLNEPLLIELESLLFTAKKFKYEKVMEDRYLKATNFEVID